MIYKAAGVADLLRPAAQDAHTGRVQYDKILPEYGFAQNKGYGSQSHIEALKRVGASPIHRRSFIKNFISEE